MAAFRVCSVFAVLALLLQGSSALICHECRTAGAPGTIDYCADPTADTLVACPRTESLCYSTLALISNRIVISRGCGRPLSLPATANLQANTCRAFGDLSATAIFCICDAQGGCNNQTAASPDVQQGLQQVQPTNNNNNNAANTDDRQSRVLVPGQVSSSTTFITAPAASAGSNTVQVLVPANQNNQNSRAVYVVQQTNPTTTTTTTTEAPATEAATSAPVVVQQNAQPQQIQVLVPNANTRPVYIVRPNGQGGQETVQIIYPSSSTTQQPQTAQNDAGITNAPVAAIRNPVIIQQLVPSSSTAAPVATAEDNVPAQQPTSGNNGTVIVVTGNTASSTESNMAEMVRNRGSTTMSPMAANATEQATTIIAVIENGTVSTPHANSADKRVVGSSAIFAALVLAIMHAIFV